MAHDLDDTKTNSRGEKRPQVGDLVAVYKFPEKKWTTVRLFGALSSEGGYWVKTKKKDGGKTRFYTPAPSYDPETQERDSTRYDPWSELADKQGALQKAKEITKEHALLNFARCWWAQGIVRSEQKKLPETMPRITKTEAKTGFKEKDSDSLTPCFGIKLGASLLGKIKELKGLNTVESRKTGAVKAYAVTDVNYGRDIRVYYDSTKAPADQYQVQLGDKCTPMTEEELAYLKQDLESACTYEFDDAAVKADFESWASRNGVKIGSKKKAAVEDDEDEDADEESDDFDDEDEAPKSKKKVAAKKPAKKAVDEDDFEEDDEDEEEAPKSKKKPAAKKKPVAEDDDFDEDDEPPAKKKPAAKKKPVAEDDDFDEDEDEESDDEEDDEDEEEAPKSKKKPPAKTASKKKPVVDEEDDFDEDEDDFDDEEEEAPKSKKPAAKKPAAKTASKKKPAADEDDFDEDEDF